MFLIGFICGVLVLTALLLLFDSDEESACPEEGLLSAMQPDAQARQSWQQTRNFLYYDGTEMPIKKEEQYE